MKLSRSTTNKVRFLLDELLPPMLRDSRWVMSLPFSLVFKDDANLVMEFKSRAAFMCDDEIAHVYEQIEWYSNERETDLNEECITKIDTSVVGKTVLDVGCGRGYLAKRLARKYEVTGVDIVIDKSLKTDASGVTFRKAAIEKLPFQNGAFDTVLCTHTLEHVRQCELAIAELRRVTKKRLIIVVPKQRMYKYTFDLHLQFFPYIYTLLQVMNSTNQSSCEEINGDLFYIENKATQSKLTS